MCISDREDFGGACEQLMHESQDLERHVNGAVLQLIVSTFKETVEPMDRLVRAALKPIVVSARVQLDTSKTIQSD